MSMYLFFSFVIAMFVTMVLIPPLKARAAQLKFIDLPDPRKVHTTPIPRIGGIAMVIGVLIPVILWARGAEEMVGYVFGAATILVFGVWDDRANLHYRAKFGGQIIAVAVLVFGGGVVIEHVPFLDDALPLWAGIPLTFIALLGITNAINLADGLDGLAGGTTLITLAAISLMAYNAGDLRLMLLALAVMGSIVGFLRFNTHPAQIFMGDGGSQFLGFSTGVLAIILTQQSNLALSPAMPLLLLGLPIIDTFIVMGQRISERRSPFSPDKNHIHHKLLGLGFDHYEAVVIIYLVQTLLVGTAVAFRFHADLWNMMVFAFVFLSAIAAFPVAAGLRWRIRARQSADAPSRLTQFIVRVRKTEVLARYPYQFIALTLPCFAILTEFSAGPQSADVVALALIFSALMIGLAVLQSAEGLNFLERGGVYLAITLVAYSSEIRSDALHHTLLENAYFVLLTVAVVFSFRFSSLKEINITPLDFLVVLLALTVPNMPGLDIPIDLFGVLVGKIFVMFYAAEVLINSKYTRPSRIRLGTALVLASIALPGLLG